MTEPDSDAVNPSGMRSPAQLNSKTFMSGMITSLAANVEDGIGLEEASWFVARVGRETGAQIADLYRGPDGRLPDTPRALGEILSDLKARIGAHFTVSSADDREIILHATRCPFGDKVKGRASLCMMTTNVFGSIVAQARGYSAVRIDEAIALGDAGCKVTITLQRSANQACHEFFG